MRSLALMFVLGGGVLCGIMEEKKKRKHHCFGMGFTKESVTGPYPEMHGHWLILAQHQIDARQQIQAEMTNNSSSLFKTHENSIYNPVVQRHLQV